METTINHLIQSGLALLVFYLFYRLILRNQPSLHYNRLFLLISPVLALIIPLLRLPLPLAATLPVAEAIPTFQLHELQVTGYANTTSVTTQTLPVGQLLLALYALVGFILLGRLIVQLVRVRRLAASASLVEAAMPEATILQTKEQLPALAFLNYIFLGNQAHLTERERKQVLAHELAHVRLRHSYDILYYEVLTALLWFNPLVWLLKEELRDVHEYQADAEVLASFQPQEYSSLLAKEALYANGIPVGSYFQKPQVFRRLQMLQRRSGNSSLMRPLLALPLLLLLLVGFSAVKASADMAHASGEPAFLTEMLITAPARKAAVPLQKPANLDSEPAENKAATAKISPEAQPTPANATKGAESVKMTTPATKTEPTTSKLRPYVYVEQMPSFKGGEGEMLKFLGQNVRYPKDAQEAGVEGLVVLSFVVDTDGSLSDITIVKSLHSAIDQEALRVVQRMNGHWSPGRQNGEAVPVRYTLPVRFSMK